MAVSTEKALMMIGIDESEQSFYALEWTLDHFITPFPPNNFPFKILLIYAKPLPTASIGLTGPVINENWLPNIEVTAGAADVLTFMEADLKKTAARVIEKAKALCHSRSVHDVAYKVIEGDARNVLCEAVEKNHASMLVLGNHGYGAIKRAFLGSVSDYCAHHAHCSIMIVKMPKKKE